MLPLNLILHLNILSRSLEFHNRLLCLIMDIPSKSSIHCKRDDGHSFVRKGMFIHSWPGGDERSWEQILVNFLWPHWVCMNAVQATGKRQEVEKREVPVYSILVNFLLGGGGGSCKPKIWRAFNQNKDCCILINQPRYIIQNFHKDILKKEIFLMLLYMYNSNHLEHLSKQLKNSTKR